MKLFITLVIIVLLTACNNSINQDKPSTSNNSIEGTWKLISGTTIEKNDSTVTDYTKDK